MPLNLKEIIAARLGENYQLHERHLNRTLVAAQRVIGFDKVYARAEGAYLWDTAGKRYIDYHAGFAPYFLGHNFAPINEAAAAPFFTAVNDFGERAGNGRFYSRPTASYDPRQFQFGVKLNF